MWVHYFDLYFTLSLRSYIFRRDLKYNWAKTDVRLYTHIRVGMPGIAICHVCFWSLISKIEYIHRLAVSMHAQQFSWPEVRFNFLSILCYHQMYSTSSNFISARLKLNFIQNCASQFFWHFKNILILWQQIPASCIWFRRTFVQCLHHNQSSSSICWATLQTLKIYIFWTFYRDVSLCFHISLTWPNKIDCVCMYLLIKK